MKNKKEYIIIFYTIFALMINLLGRTLATKLVLPIWCDSIGTFLIAYVAGPVCGGIVGFTNNIIYGTFVEQKIIYCIIGAFLGIIVGYMAKKKVFETQFSTMTLGMDLAIFSTIVAFIINFALYDGRCGNVWGEQVMMLCLESGFPKFVAYLVSQFCVEFLDKLLSVEIVYIVIKIVRHKRQNRGLIFLAVIFISFLVKGEVVMAEEKSLDYDSYVQIEYSQEEGLLSGEANDIEQTKDGKLWIGTYAGLYSYNNRGG